MGDTNFTLLELHFDGPLRIGPSFGSEPEPDVESASQAPTVESDGGENENETETESAPIREDGGAPVKGAILGVIAIVALAVAARVLLGDDEADEPELVDLEDAPDADSDEDTDAA